MNLKRSLLLTSTVLFIASCGGGGSDDDNNEGNNSSSGSSTQEAAGIYTGTINYTANSDVGQTSDSLVGFVAPSGTVAFLSENLGSITIGDITIADDGSFTGSGTEYDTSGASYGSGTVSGDYGSANQTLSGSSFDNSGTKLSDYNLNYDAQTSDVGASFNQIVGSYDSGEINIDSSGNINVDDGSTCQGTGSITIPDSGLNLYRFTVTLNGGGGCDAPDGSYDGYMSLVDGSLIYLLYNDNLAAYFEL